ncbi:YbaK/EbsC family protein [Szabonella alba]|uniref:YbaK/EbsC family protein n=1 Tax=Szabonella alba TaxID=2804194 RepID=A0A8K0VDM3_9RHOB|nr:YbaK/EbsC family protein [Szabonella alba]MBL4917900.1 YbaK/EbsC family protein [Szabonella alba]
MGKSLERVRRALVAAGLADTIREAGQESRTAALAAEAIGCEIDQIAKSILFRGESSGALWLFVTAGGRRVEMGRAAELSGEPLGQAEATQIRQVTGFAIGGVAPLGHLTPPRGFFDRRLTDFATVWAAAGTPLHVFAAGPALLAPACGLLIEDFSVQ